MREKWRGGEGRGRGEEGGGEEERRGRGEEGKRRGSGEEKGGEEEGKWRGEGRGSGEGKGGEEEGKERKGGKGEKVICEVRRRVHSVHLGDGQTREGSGYLSVVVKVSKLSLPADQRVWIAHGEAELKPHHSKLREGAVAHGIPRLCLGDVAERPRNTSCHTMKLNSCEQESTKKAVLLLTQLSYT